ncbi:hypothetical protein [Kitasatospora sp. NA04385]|uniref:hypothetical protein n=1 Tax=Kitasatospora sp. NA04385 TaxID=2742135 RepID=UPI0034CFB2E4
MAAVAGRLELAEREWRAAGFVEALALADLAGDPAESMARAGELAELAGERLAARLLR